jgi:hypothetical protein
VIWTVAVKDWILARRCWGKRSLSPIGRDRGPVRVTVFCGETEECALQRHRKLRPDHAGRRVWLQHRLHHGRDARSEYLATALSSSEDEQRLRDLIAQHDGETRGAGMILPRQVEQGDLVWLPSNEGAPAAGGLLPES